MRKVQIICSCGKLVEISDRKILPHKTSDDDEFCMRSGDKYVPSPQASSAVVEGRSLELLGSLEIPCPACNEHPIGGLAVYGPKKSESKDYPEWTGPISSVVN